MGSTALLALTTVGAAVGCARSAQAPGTTVRASESDRLGRAAATRGAIDLRCPEQHISVRALGASGYEVRGCGSLRSYTCTMGAHRQPVCVAEGEVRAAPTPAVASSDEVVRTALEAIRPGLLACVASPERAIELLLAIPQSGTVTVARWRSLLSVDERTCGSAVIAGMTLPNEVRQARTLAVRLDSTGVVIGTDAHGEESGPDAPAARALADGNSGQVQAGVSPDTAASIRSALDARAESILACSASSALAIGASWSSGSITFTLRAELHGTDVEGCVRALTADIPAPPDEGSLLHVVHRP